MTESLPEDEASQRLSLNEAIQIVAEVAAELALSCDALICRRAYLGRVASQLNEAMREWPDCPDAWNELAPFVVNHQGEITTVPEMLLIGDQREPRRIARLLLRSLDWDLPPIDA